MCAYIINLFFPSRHVFFLYFLTVDCARKTTDLEPEKKNTSADSMVALLFIETLIC